MNPRIKTIGRAAAITLGGMALVNFISPTEDEVIDVHTHIYKNRSYLNIFNNLNSDFRRSIKSASWKIGKPNI